LGEQFDRGSAAIAATLAPPDSSSYVAAEPITSAFASMLKGRGVRGIVVPEQGLSPVDERLFNRTLTQPFNLADADGVQAVAADSALHSHLGETGDPVLDANHLLADLAVLYFDDPPDTRAAVVSFAPDDDIDPQFVDTLLGGLDPSVDRILKPIAVATLFSSVPRAGSRGETNGRGTPLERTLVQPTTADLVPFQTNLRDAQQDVESYADMVTADNPRPADFARRLLVAGSASLSDGERTAYLDDVRNEIHAETAKVQPPGKQTINFTAQDGVVSLTVHNTSGYPMKVLLHLQGQKLEFPGHEDGNVEVTLTEETTRVPLNVHTRASGDSPLDVTVSAPDGRLVIGRTRITVRSTAFSGVGIVLSVGAGLFLAVWWIRSAISSRRQRRRRLRHAVPSTRR
jgi:hypothetical protein